MQTVGSYLVAHWELWAVSCLPYGNRPMQRGLFWEFYFRFAVGTEARNQCMASLHVTVVEIHRNWSFPNKDGSSGKVKMHYIVNLRMSVNLHTSYPISWTALCLRECATKNVGHKCGNVRMCWDLRSLRMLWSPDHNQSATENGYYRNQDQAGLC